MSDEGLNAHERSVFLLPHDTDDVELLGRAVRADNQQLNLERAATDATSMEALRCDPQS